MPAILLEEAQIAELHHGHSVIMMTFLSVPDTDTRLSDRSGIRF